jgi:hypothetical protein
MKNLKVLALVLSLTFTTILPIEPYELVKTCESFRDFYLDACEKVGYEKLNHEMNLLRNVLTGGGSVIYYQIISIAIDDCIRLLTPLNDDQARKLINTLYSFKEQINDTEMYDLATGTVTKQENLKSGTTRTIRAAYNASRCYRVAHPAHLDKKTVAA